MFFSPAKLNLFFHVSKKRSDGFHEIASLVQAIDLGDSLTIHPSHAEKDSLSCTDPFVPVDETNLILRASSLFKEKTGVKQNFSFLLEKKIPLEAGLGGGSSNAATTLWALNQLMETGIDDATLASWGGTLGSDVPFFFSLGRAHCEGRGEKCISLEKSEMQSVWIAKPKKGLSTKVVYENLNVKELTCQDEVRNDLEFSAFQLMPELALLKSDLMNLGFKQVLMTGSGTAFYCFGNNRDPFLPEIKFYQAHFLTRSPKNWYKFP